MPAPSELQDTSNFAEAMKIRYSKAVSETINRRAVLYNILQKTREHWTGKQHQTPVYVRSANSVGARNESGGLLPTAGADTYLESVITNKNNYVVIKTTNIAEALTSQGGAWASVRSSVIRNGAKDLADSMNRQLHGNGFGILGECESVSSVGVVHAVTISTYGDPALTNDAGTAPDTTKHFKVGMRVVWGLYSGGVQFAATPPAVPTADGVGYVSAITAASPHTVVEITATSGNAPDAGDVFVIGEATAEASNSFNKEMMGVDTMVKGSGALQGITDAAWQAKVLSNPAGAGTERQLTEDLMQQAVDQVNDLSNGEADIIICHTTTRRAYLNLMKNKGAERFAPTKLAGGHTTLTFNGGMGDIPIFADKDAIHRSMFFLTKAHVKMYEVSGFRWDETGGEVWKWVSGEDAATAFGRTYTNLGTDNRKSLCRIDDIAVTGIAA